MLRLLQNPYFDVLLWAIISFSGVYFYQWEMSQVLFFIYLHHLIKVPSTIYTNYYLYNKNWSKASGFVFLYLVFFGVYSFFFMAVIYQYYPGHHHNLGFMDPFFSEFSGLLKYYGMPFIALILVEFITIWAKIRHLEPNEEQADKMVMRNMIYYGTMMVVVLLSALPTSSEFNLYSTQESIAALTIFTLAELFFARSRRLTPKMEK
ncbi:MAG: hypothetical protein HUJ25_01595 [Crocinitomicaceae bacterium]|nr:hypothetical protein [Crocinitomicaceae bacterium]